MKQITIRRVDERCLQEAKRIAKQRGVATNTVLVAALEQGLGFSSTPRTNGLEKYSADSDFGPEWESRMNDLNIVHPEDWR